MATPGQPAMDKVMAVAEQVTAVVVVVDNQMVAADMPVVVEASGTGNTRWSAAAMSAIVDIL